MKLSNITKILHIIIALSIICLLAVGIYMVETEAYALYPIHKSIGAIVFVIALFRIFIRIKEGWPDTVGVASKIQLAIAKVVHWGLITLTVVYPASGLMMSGAGGHGIYIFGLELVASNYDKVTGDAIALNEGVASLGHTLHGSLVLVLIAFIVLHVLGALKHHLVDKDETITRMFTFK
jgi:cytochrome b561